MRQAAGWLRPATSRKLHNLDNINHMGEWDAVCFGLDLLLMEIAFPIEFLVHGTPVSLQARRADSREKWKARVRQASRSAIPEAYFASRGRMAVTLFYLPDGRMQGDIDNIVKPVIDALARHIYIDDRQVERIVVQKFEPDRVFSFVEPTEILARALSGRRPVLYIRVSDDPTAELS